MIYPRNRISNLPCVFEPGDYLSIANHLAILGILGYGSSCENLSTVLWHPRGANDWSHERHWAGQAKRCLGRVEMLFFFMFIINGIHVYIYIITHTCIYICIYVIYIHMYIYFFYIYIHTIKLHRLIYKFEPRWLQNQIRSHETVWFHQQ